MTEELASLDGAASLPTAVTTMSNALQSREMAQVQVAMLVAVKFPRDEVRSLDRIMNACTRPSLAETALYQYSRGGTDITGPTIRLAEAVAQNWGNIECGWREVDRVVGEDGVGMSFIEAYAWDMQTNVRVPRTFTVRHWRDTKKGGYKITDERDIYELCANQASRRLRACIISIIPGDVFEKAIQQCHTTMAADAKTDPEAQKKIVEVFAEFGVTKAQIEARIQRRLDSITPAQVVTLRRILNSIKAGMSEASEWFEPEESVRTEAIDPFAKTNEGSEPPADPGGGESATTNNEAVASTQQEEGTLL